MGIEWSDRTYGSATELRATLEYDLSEEKKFSYRNLSIDELIHHLAVFVSRLWQIHVFSEGNTRTTAVFFIKYLRTLGFDVTNDIFAENAWYFRNALVRANYNDLKNGAYETTEYVEIFLRNLLLNESHPLQNRVLHISGVFKKTAEPDIEETNPDIGTKNRTLKLQTRTLRKNFRPKQQITSQTPPGVSGRDNLWAFGCDEDAWP